MQYGITFSKSRTETIIEIINSNDKSRTGEYLKQQIDLLYNLYFKHRTVFHGNYFFLKESAAIKMLLQPCICIKTSHYQIKQSFLKTQQDVFEAKDFTAKTKEYMPLLKNEMIIG